MTDKDLNQLETTIREGMAGRVSQSDLHAAVLETRLFVPSATEVGPDGEHTPMRLPLPGGGGEMVVAYTHPKRITADASARAPHVFEVGGTRYVRNLSPELGLVIFARNDAAAILDPVTLNALRRSIYT